MATTSTSAEIPNTQDVEEINIFKMIIKALENNSSDIIYIYLYCKTSLL